LANTIKKLWRLGAFALLAFSSVGLADQLIVTSPGNNPYGGEWIGPYTATLNPGTTNAQTVSVICDDFASVTYLNTLYNYDISSGLTVSSTTKWQDQATYDKIAYLATKLIDPNLVCGQGLNCKGDIQFAIWSMFAGSALNQPGINVLAVNGWVADANAWYDSKIKSGLTSAQIAGEFSRFDIATPTATQLAGTSLPQEFLVVRADEAPVSAILALNLLGLCALVVAFRRRTQQVN
jgi:hypothetical protein